MIKVFAYGTVRPGGHNYRRVSKGIVNLIRHCTTEGRIYSLTHFGGYPLARFDEEGTVHGDILIYENQSSPGFRYLCNMEIGAGYSLQPIQVSQLDDNQRVVEVHDCFAFQYEGSPNPDYLIESGDWNDFAMVDR